MPGTLSRLQRRRFAAGGSYDWGGPQSLIPGGSAPATPIQSGDRTYTPLASPGDYYTYGQGPEHTFFSGKIQTPPLQHDVSIPRNPAGSGGGSGGVGGTLSDIVQLAGAAKNAGALLNQAGVDNAYTRAMQNPVGAIKDAYGNYQLNNQVGSGKYANNALNDSGYGSNWTTPALTGVGAGAGTLGALSGSGGAGLTASITPELITGGEGAIAATTGAGTAAGAGTGAAGSGTLGTLGGGATGAGTGATAAVPLGATAAGAAILAAAAAGLYGSGQKANSERRAATNEGARTSFGEYLRQLNSIQDAAKQGVQFGPTQDTPESYSSYFKLPTDLSYSDYSNMPIEKQQQIADKWMQDTGNSFDFGSVENGVYSPVSSGRIGAPAGSGAGGSGMAMTPAQQLFHNSALASGYVTPEYGSDEYNALIASVMGPGGGMAHGGSPGTLGHLAASNDPKFLGKVRGPGTGRSDEIPARLSDGEYVMDAETVSMLGDGSTEAGSKKLDQMRAKLRAHKGKVLAKGKFSPNAKDPMHYLGGK